MQSQPNDIILYIISWLDDQIKLVVVSKINKRFYYLVKLLKNITNNLEDVLINNKYLSYEYILTKKYLELTSSNIISNKIILNLIGKILNNNKLINFLKKIDMESDEFFERYNIIIWCINNSFVHLAKILYNKIRPQILNHQLMIIVSTIVRANNIEIFDHVTEQEFVFKYFSSTEWTANIFIRPIIIEDNVEMIKNFIKKGLNISQTGDHRATLISYAELFKSVKILDYLRSEFAKTDDK